MEPTEYLRLAQHESALWWFSLLHRNLFALLDSLNLSKPALTCADFGCGTGGFVAKLRNRFPTWSVVGLDKSSAAIEFARQTHGQYFICGDGQQPPFKYDFFDIIFAVDVMYHRDVQPSRMLEAIFAVLKPGGIAVLNNPAYEWLRSYHDDFVYTARRYTAHRVAADLRQANYTVVRCTYWNTILFPLMVLRRKLLTGPALHSDVGHLSPLMNGILSMISLPESVLMRYGVNLPFGGSVLAVARKGP